MNENVGYVCKVGNMRDQLHFVAWNVISNVSTATAGQFEHLDLYYFICLQFLYFLHLFELFQWK